VSSNEVLVTEYVVTTLVLPYKLKLFLLFLSDVIFKNMHKKLKYSRN